jgi:hypothetical protein
MWFILLIIGTDGKKIQNSIAPYKQYCPKSTAKPIIGDN